MTIDIHDFTTVRYYLRPSRRVYMLVDDTYADAQAGLRIGLGLERHYFPDSMRSLPSVLAEHSQFLLTSTSDRAARALAAARGWHGDALTQRIWLWSRE